MLRHLDGIFGVRRAPDAMSALVECRPHIGADFIYILDHEDGVFSFSGHGVAGPSSARLGSARLGSARLGSILSLTRSMCQYVSETCDNFVRNQSKDVD